MAQNTIDAEADRLSVGASDELPMSIIAEVGGAFAWLADEPDIYSDADLLQNGARPPFSTRTDT